MKDNLEMILAFPLLILGIIITLIATMIYTALTAIIMLLESILRGVYKLRRWVF